MTSPDVQVAAPARKSEALPAPAAAAVRRDPPRIMTLPEVSAYLCSSPRKIRDLVKLRRIPSLNLSGMGRGKLLFRLQDVEAFLAQLSRKAA